MQRFRVIGTRHPIRGKDIGHVGSHPFVVEGGR
jgi:hypothetical protein